MQCRLSPTTSTCADLCTTLPALNPHTRPLPETTTSIPILPTPTHPPTLAHPPCVQVEGYSIGEDFFSRRSAMTSLQLSRQLQAALRNLSILDAGNFMKGGRSAVQSSAVQCLALLSSASLFALFCLPANLPAFSRSLAANFCRPCRHPAPWPCRELGDGGRGHPLGGDAGGAAGRHAGSSQR